MCLSIWLEAAASDRETLVAAAKSASRFGLRVEVPDVSTWLWARSEPPRATVTEDGTCSCSMLSDDADWNAASWAMRPDVIEPLARTLDELLRLGPRRVVVTALWAGDRPKDELVVTAADLVRIVRTTGLGTKRHYVVDRGTA